MFNIFTSTSAATGGSLNERLTFLTCRERTFDFTAFQRLAMTIQDMDRRPRAD